MQKPFYIPNLQTPFVTKGVADKIKKNTLTEADTLYAKKNNVLKPINKAKDYFISNTGDDATADGTQQKPFKTLFACYSYIRNNFYFASLQGTTSLTQTIKFLTDYTEKEDQLEFPQIVNSSLTAMLHVVVDGTGKNVKLRSVRLLNSYLNFKNITFLGFNGYAVRTDGESSVVLSNCLIDTSSNTAPNTEPRTTIFINDGGTCVIDGNLTLTLTGQNIIRVFHVDIYSELNFLANSSITINKSFNVNDAFILASTFSFIRFHTTFKFILNDSVTVTGKKYSVIGNSILNAFGKGADFIPGTIPGTIQTQGQYF